MSNDSIVNFAFLVAAKWHSCNMKKKIVKPYNLSYQLMHTPPVHTPSYILYSYTLGTGRTHSPAMPMDKQNQSQSETFTFIGDCQFKP